MANPKGNPTKHVTDRLAYLLRNHGKSGMRARQATCPTPPLITSLTFNGVPLRTVMSPEVPSDPHQCELIFDTWLAHLVEVRDTGTAVTTHDDFIQTAGRTLYDFITLGATFGDSVVRLVFALSRHGHLVYSERSIEVFIGELTFGVTDGVVESRFSKGIIIDLPNPCDVLERPGEINVRDRYFCSMYREARGCHEADVVEALVAVAVGNPAFKWKKLCAKASAVPPRSRMDSWENAILHQYDPMQTVYRGLVPRYMTATEYANTFGPLAARLLEPTLLQKQAYIQRLSNFFTRKKGKVPEIVGWKEAFRVVKTAKTNNKKDSK